MAPSSFKVYLPFIVICPESGPRIGGAFFYPFSQKMSNGELEVG